VTRSRGPDAAKAKVKLAGGVQELCGDAPAGAAPVRLSAPFRPSSEGARRLVRTARRALENTQTQHVAFSAPER
jgi:hypothetical protein